MNITVNKLLDVDRKARQMLDEAQQYYNRTLSEIESEKAAMQREFSDKGRHHLEELRQEQQQELQQYADAAQQRAQRLLAAMEARYEQNHLQWEDELYHRTIF